MNIRKTITLMTFFLLQPLTAFSNPQKSPAFLADGNSLIAGCSQEIQYLNGEPLYGQDAYNAGTCQGYIIGIKDEFFRFIYLSNIMKVEEYKCYLNSMGTATNEQFIRIVYQYLQEHPKELNQPSTDLVINALTSAYPLPEKCKNLDKN